MATARKSFLRLTWDDLSTGDQQELEVPLDLEKPVKIGRASTDTIALDPKHIMISSSSVSKRHAELSSRNGQVFVTDLESLNGIFVAGKAIQPKTPIPLNDGNSFTITPIDFLVSIKTPLKVSWTKQGRTETKIAWLPISLGRGTPDKVITIVLPDGKASRDHADIELQGEQLMLIDHSRNGTRVKGRKYHNQQVSLQAGDKIQIGQYTIAVDFSEEPAENDLTVIAQDQSQIDLGATTIIADDDEATFISDEGTVVISTSTGTRRLSRNQEVLPFDSNNDLIEPVPILRPESINLPPIFNSEVVRYKDLGRAGMAMQETTYLAIGGGVGSFVWADHLVISGADPKNIIALGFPPKPPYGRYQQLCRNSKIPGHERLRSNSDSCPDNIWGWPGYAVREIWGSIKQADFALATRIAWQIFNEPIADTYTPRSKDVFDSIDLEAERIGWNAIWRPGRVEAIRKTDDGRYVILYSDPQENNQRFQRLIVAQYVHLAVGYPGINFLDDLLEYRKRTKDTKGVVNAYEDHEHVYEHLLKKGGTVLLRGRGIVASRVMQTLNEIRVRRSSEHKKDDIRILHLMRSAKPEGYTFGRTRRLVEHQWEFQPFNWPKATWSGPMRVQLARAPDPMRTQLLTDWEGTTTASRSDWRHIIKTGLREGWYDQQFGAVKTVEYDSTNRKVVTTIDNSKFPGRVDMLPADFIIDATGLQKAKLDNNPLLSDLKKQYGLKPNPRGALAVTNEFEIKGLSNGKGRMYAAGVITLGGPYAPVDTFLGLQYAALRSVDDLTKLKAPGLKKLNHLRSIAQWIRWALGVKP